MLTYASKYIQLIYLVKTDIVVDDADGNHVKNSNKLQHLAGFVAEAGWFQLHFFEMHGEDGTQLCGLRREQAGASTN